ncbi:MAG: hypothetical protein QGI60_01415 [archaeon]|jgi:hypothetical protein|nr:hypothetical protein [archaeon]
MPVRRTQKRRDRTDPRKSVREPVKRPIPVSNEMLSKLGTHQVGVTKKVIGYVAKFKTADPLKRVKLIVADIASFEKVDLPVEKAGEHWANRSAERIIERRNVAVARQPVPDGAPEISGCTDYASAICASIRAIGLPASFVRMGNHSHVKFLYEGEVYIADPGKKRRAIVRKMTTADKINERIWKRNKAFAEGKSPADIGLKTVEDFYKYSSAKVRRYGRGN